MKKTLTIALSVAFIGVFGQTKISDLPATTTLTGVELFPVVQGGVTKKTTAAQIASLSAASATNYVPYSGATSSVNLGSQTFSTTGSVYGSNIWYNGGNTVGTNTAFIGTNDNRSFYLGSNNNKFVKVDSIYRFIYDAPSTSYSNKVQISQWPGFTDIPALFIGVSAPTTTNYAIIGDGSNNVFNAPSSLSFRTANSVVFLAQNTASISSSIFLLSGFTKNPVAAASNFIQADIQGNDITWDNGTTVAQRKMYLRGDALKAVTTATITDAVSLEIEDPTASSGMTFTRKWALRARGNSIFNGSVTIGSALTTTAPAGLYVNNTASVTGILRAESGIGVGVNPSSIRPFNASASVAGEYSYFITNLSSGASAQAAIRLGNNSNEGTIGVSSTGATTGNGLYPRSMNFNINEPGGFSFNQQASATSGAYTRFRIWGIGNYTNQTTATEIPGFEIKTFTRGWATGNIAIQREHLFPSVTYSAIGASVITNAFGMYVSAPTMSTNMTATNNWALGLEGGLKMTSTTQGFLPPRMTATQGSAISSPAEGLMIYVTDTNGTFTAKGWWGYDGAAWQKLNN